MKKFEGMLFCTDLDGTLLKRDKTISKENISAIEYFKEEGGFFTFVTGRMPFFVSDIYEAINPNVPFGCIDGGGLYDHRKMQYVWTQELAAKALELLAYADQSFPTLGIQINTFDRTYFCKENKTMERFRRATKVPNLVCDYHNFHEPIAKILFGDERPDTIRLLQEKLNAHPMASAFDFIRPEENLYEILPKGVSKGGVLLKLIEILGVDPNKTIAIGDYNNDISMIRAAKLGVAVSNACSDAKAAADYVTVSNEEHAIAKIIEELDHGAIVL